VEATIRDTQELRWWLLGFGDAVEVLALAHLRKEFTERVAAMNRLYRQERFSPHYS
jgi:predicted DNA-binding transcriptional regulator YafY